MPTVDELGMQELKRLAALHSPAEQARAAAEVARERAAFAKADYDRTMRAALEAARASKSLMNTPDFRAAFDQANQLLRVARHCEAMWTRREAKAQRLERAARRLAETAA
ncbi:MAG: hypothetical protein KGL46_03890 [Hyphomicrobiales bacterium]|nr:hypothetical protein [Hyphomicrobiales bacterium]